MPRQIAKWGGSLAQWKTNMDTLESKIHQRCTYIESKISSCYSVTATPLTVDVDPPGVGSVKLNSIWLTNYKWSGTYFAPVIMTFKETVIDTAHYEFDYWEFKNHTPSPDVHADSVSINYGASDDVIAHFTEKTSDVIFPTAFTPNGDGRNDVLLPLGTKYIKSLSIEIWNRWGQLVYSSTDPTHGWDGYYQSTEAQTGVYAYFIKYVTSKGDEKTSKGNVTLIR